jgi:uncharacterized delta-60 repeat protein
MKRYSACFRAVLLTATFLFLRPLISQAADGDLDSSFNCILNGFVNCVSLQPDGRILIGGSVTNVGGMGLTNIARLNADGTVDISFNPNVNYGVSSIVVQADGKILIGGAFTSVGGTPRNCLARLNADGTLDNSFNPNASTNVGCIALQTDGRILIGGKFTSVGGTPRNYIARLNADGTLDNSFNPNPDNQLNCIAIQADGEILIGGAFSKVGGTLRGDIARLNTDGTLDTSFTPYAGGIVYSIAIQADRKILFSGDGPHFIARVNADGTDDFNFSTGAPSGTVFSIAVEADGRIFLMCPNKIVRVNVGGGLDSSFSQNLVNPLPSVSLAVQADGKILIGGGFTSVGGVTRYGVARLLNTPASQALSIPDSTRVQWLRSGTAPEVQQVTFELSTDGSSSWTSLGSGTRISGGWELTGLSLPLNGSIRARGWCSAGFANGSSSVIEQVGSISSSVTLNAALTDGNMVLSWPTGVLQSSDRVDGTYTNVPNAASPFTITPTGSEQYYYRVKVQ